MVDLTPKDHALVEHVLVPSAKKVMVIVVAGAALWYLWGRKSQRDLGL